MTYTVVYRGKDGAQSSLEIDASSKSELWTKLSERGISAISVSEGKRSSARRAGADGRRIVAIGTICALLAAVMVALWMCRDKGREDAQNPKTTTELPVRKPTLRKNKADEAAEMPIALPVPKISTNRLERRVNISEPLPLEELQQAMTNKPPKQKAAFKTSAEELIALATPSSPGAYVPPLPEITDESIADDLNKALQNRLSADEGDSDELLERKQIVELAKDEFAELEKKGGFTFSEYLKSLRHQANLDYEFLAEAHKLGMEIYHDQNISDETYIQYRDQINSALRARGLPEIDRDDDQDQKEE